MKKYIPTAITSLILTQCFAFPATCIGKESTKEHSSSEKSKGDKKISANERERVIEQVIHLLSNYTDNDHPTLSRFEDRLSKWPSESAKALIDALDTNNEKVKSKIAGILRNLAHKQDFAIDIASLKTLIGITKASTDSESQAALIETLGIIGPRAPELRKALISIYNDNVEIRVKRVAMDALTAVARKEKPPQADPEEVKVVISALRNPDAPSLRASAARALGQICDKGEGLKALIEALDDNYIEVRRDAAHALGQYGVDAKPAAPRLLAAMKAETDHSMRHACLHAMQSIATLDESVAQELIGLLDDKELGVFVLAQLYAIGPFQAPAIPKLIKWLKSPEEMHRVYAAADLGYLGPVGSDALPALEVATTDSSASVKQYAQQAIERIKGTKPVPRCAPGF